MKKYIVLVDALGFEGGCARKDEVIEEANLGKANIKRLVEMGTIIEYFEEIPLPEPKEPVTVQDDSETPLSEPLEPFLAAGNPEEDILPCLDFLSLGKPIPEGYDFSDDELNFINEILDGKKELPFNIEKVMELKRSEIETLIENLDFEKPSKTVSKIGVAEHLAQCLFEYLKITFALE